MSTRLFFLAFVSLLFGGSAALSADSIQCANFAKCPELDMILASHTPPREQRAAKTFALSIEASSIEKSENQILLQFKDSEVIIQDPKGFFPGNTVYQIPRAGFYQINISIVRRSEWKAAHGSNPQEGNRDDTYLRVYKGRTKRIMEVQDGQTSSIGPRTSASLSRLFKFNKGDELTFAADSDTGGPDDSHGWYLETIQIDLLRVGALNPQ